MSFKRSTLASHNQCEYLTCKLYKHIPYLRSKDEMIKVSIQITYPTHLCHKQGAESMGTPTL